MKKIRLKIRVSLEEKKLVPTDYGKDPPSQDDFIQDHCTSSGLHVSLQVEAFGHFIHKMKYNYRMAQTT